MNGAQPDAVRRKVAAWLVENDGAPAIALAAPPHWAGDPVLTIGDATVRVVECPTPLAARAALYGRADGERLALLTDLADVDLGDGLLAHVSRQTVRLVNPWELVRQMFGGARLDPSLPRTGAWVPAALGQYAPADGWSAPPGSVLTRDHALCCLAAAVLGVPRDQLDLSGLLQWTTDAPAQRVLSDADPAVADGLVDYLGELAGPGAAPILAAVRAGHGIDAIPIGLLTGILWPAGAGSTTEVDIAVARTRLEPRLGGLRLTQAQADAFRGAAEAWVDRSLESGDSAQCHEAMRLLRRAEALATEIDVSARMATSVVLPAGFAQRLQDLAERISEAVADTGAPAVAQAQQAFEAAAAHRAAQPHRLTTALMAVRLLRWLATPPAAAPTSLGQALDRYVADDGWVDRAQLDVFAGDTDPRVARAYRELHRAVDARRARHDERFARLLAQATRADAEPGALLRIEDVLDRVVQPMLDAGRRALLVVLDGMSVAAATEIGERLTTRGSWLELTLGGGPRVGVLAALPTVTEVSRCSLLSGQLTVGRQDAERAAFTRRYPAGVLLHKGDLRAGAGSALDPEIVAALAERDVPVVAAVVNTIDDALDRSEPGTTVWGEDTIPALADLLALAADRVVVLVSDHGHVVDRGPEAQTRPSPSAENRWRPATAPAEEGEVTVAGPRVGLGGGTVVLPWRETLRYGPRKAGYHGGAAPAEAVIPLLVFSAGEDGPPGWAPAPVSSPPWWRDPLDDDPPPSPGGPQAPSAAVSDRRSGRPLQPDALFELGEPAPAPAPADATPAGGGHELIQRLLASERYRQRRDARAPLPDERVAALLETLLGAGDRAGYPTLAARAGVPVHRIHGVVTALRKLLQVEGYPVLTVDTDGSTVLLDRALLIEQFGLRP